MQKAITHSTAQYFKLCLTAHMLSLVQLRCGHRPDACLVMAQEMQSTRYVHQKEQSWWYITNMLKQAIISRGSKNNLSCLLSVTAPSQSDSS